MRSQLWIQTCQGRGLVAMQRCRQPVYVRNACTIGKGRSYLGDNKSTHTVSDKCDGSRKNGIL